MSHVVGTVQTLGTALIVGPDTGAAPSAPNTWSVTLNHTPAPTGTKFVILHFRNVSLPANNRLEVDLGYGTDVFTSANGAEFWTRPVNIHALPSALVPIRYVTDGAATGSAQLDRYGRGERHAGEQDPSALSNCDPFLPASPYTEPIYDPFWFCGPTPNWENAVCATPVGDVRRRVSASVGMIVTVHHDHSGTGVEQVSTCSVTLVGPDLVLTAGHCLADPAEEVATSSVTFDYQTQCDGSRPAGYAARFHKVRAAVKFQNQTIGGIYHDYCLLQLQIPSGGLGIPVIPMRGDLPGAGEQIFGVHHPNGAVKKLSVPHPAFSGVISSAPGGVRVNLDVSGGSSGSGLFDTAGRIVGVCSNGGSCSLNYYPTATLLQNVAAPVGPPVNQDVMIVFDRSGSMSLSAGTVPGRTRIQEAREAASLFIQLVRAGAGNRIGLVSFSTMASAPVDAALANATAGHKTALIGPSPFTSGIVGGLAPGGNTSIGDGLEAGRDSLPAGPNPRAILLMTDGLQNTPPMIEAVGPTLGAIQVNAIGFGAESSLNGALLSQLAQAHNGVYTRAGTGLHLKKFFALAFGNIFEAGTLLDPDHVLKRGERAATPEPFHVCGEEAVTVVVGWDDPDAVLRLQLRTPLGALVDAGTAGVESSSGATWTFLRVPLPQGAERDGLWHAEVFRPGSGSDEFPPPMPQAHYFLSVLARGGPTLRRVDARRTFFTGDAINPLVELRYPDGTFPTGGQVRLTVTRPASAAGDLLARTGLRPAVLLDGDTIPARQATLQALEAEEGAPVVAYEDETVELLDEREHNGGRFEHAGIFGRRMADLLRAEGNYTFRVVATYGHHCTATREAVWSLYVDVGIDPGKTTVTVDTGNPRPDGTRPVRVTVVPRDKYGHQVGPGRGDAVVATGTPGTTVTGDVVDNGDGSYTVPGTWDPSGGTGPGLVIGQPGRPGVVVQPAQPGPVEPADCRKWKMLVWFLLFLLLVLLLLLLFT
jgi:Trypsin-like peptidase domain/von Willebrand factor type A domain